MFLFGGFMSLIIIFATASWCPHRLLLLQKMRSSKIMLFCQLFLLLLVLCCYIDEGIVYIVL